MTFMAFFVAILIIVIIFVSVSNGHKKQALTKYEKVNSFIISKYTNFDKAFYLNTNLSFDKNELCKLLFLVDTKAKQIGLIDYEKSNIVCVDFKDIINYEIYENGTLVTTGVGGGVRAGIGIGVGIGAYTSNTTSAVRELRLIVRINNITYPQIAYDLVFKTLAINWNNNKGVEKNSVEYADMISSLQQVVSFLEIVMHENKKDGKNE